MINYSDYLICSDYDSTLSYGGVCEKNIRAINRFTSQGGKFTLGTGRSGSGLLNDIQIDFEINAPIVGLTGSQIYDGKRKTVVESYCLDEKWPTLVRDLIENIEYEQTLELVGVNNTYRFSSSDRDECARILNTFGSETLYKITGYTDYRGDLSLVPGISEICHNRYNTTANGHGTYEITRLGIDKGYSAQRVRELVGAKILICVGDYLGDIAMLKKANISYAVENAIDEVKAVADRITVHAADGAIAKIIEDIEQGLC